MRKLLIITFVAVLAMSAVSVAKATAQLNDGESSPGTTAIKPLNESDNPYRNMYSAYDQWINDHLVDHRTFFTPDNPEPEDWQVEGAWINDNGYLIPLEVRTEYVHELIAKGNTGEEVFPFSKILAEGVMPSEVYDEKIKTNVAIQAEFYNAVPKWLVEDLPQAAYLYPNGDIVTKGLLGSYYIDESSDISNGIADDEIWCRYDANGNLIKTSIINRMFLYFDKDSLPYGHMEKRIDGYILFYDPKSDELLSVWEYDGTKTDFTEQPEKRDYHPFTLLTATNLQLIFEAQNQNW